MVTKKHDLWIGDNWEEMGFNFKGRDHASHDIKVLCPACSEERKNKHDPCVSVRPLDGVGNCKNCGVAFVLRKEERQEFKKTIAEPRVIKPTNLTKLSEPAFDFIRNRMISQEAIKTCRISEDIRRNSIAFTYFLNGTVVNIKYRSIKDKSFSQEVGGYHMLWNYDVAKKSVAQTKSLIITEGEFDAAAWVTVGVNWVTSLDSGAPNPQDRTIEKKFECITNSFDLIELAEVVYLAMDNDENGRIAQTELIRRIGAEKVRLIDFGKYKDSNEYLLYEGREALAGLLKTAKQPKVEGVFTASDVYDKVMNLHKVGLTKGTSTYMPSIDEGWKWRMSEVNVWTGYNNEGKSKLLRYLELVKAKIDGWKFALFIPEDMPLEEWYEDMCHMYIGKSLDPDLQYRASEAEVIQAMAFLEEHFFVVYPPKDFTLDVLFEKFLYLIKSKGVRVIDIDPYNTVEHLYGKNMTIDQYVSWFMGKVHRFAKEHSVVFNVVFHQNPPDKKNDDGTLPPPKKYRIKNGGTVSDKADNVLAVWRPRRQIDYKDPVVTFITEKIKKQKLTGMADMSIDIHYDFKSNRYLDPKLNLRSPLEIPATFL